MDAVVKSSFWTDDRIELLSAERKLALLWLITNPARDLCGFTKVSGRRFSFETGLPLSELDAACESLRSSFEAPSEGVYFAVNFLRHQFGKGGAISLKNNVVISAIRYASKLPEPLQRAFFNAYPELLKNGEDEPPESPSQQPPSKPLPTPPGGVRVEKEKSRASLEEGSGEKPNPEHDPVNIVALYPKNQSRNEAMQHIARHIRSGVHPQEIIDGTRAIAAVIQQLPSGALNTFVPSADRFFREKKWLDDPKTWLGRGATGSNGAIAPKESLGGREGTVVKLP